MRTTVIAASTTSSGFNLLPLLIVIVGAGIYFTPTFVAAARRSSRLGPILALNLLAGWTVAGWVVALVLAIQSPPWPDKPGGGIQR
jgi:hypothetical protein